MGIGSAIEKLRHGYSVQRFGWNGKNQFLKLQMPDEKSFMTEPYVYITTEQGTRIPWLASQADLLAEDWIAF